LSEVANDQLCAADCLVAPLIPASATQAAFLAVPV